MDSVCDHDAYFTLLGAAGIDRQPARQPCGDNLFFILVPGLLLCLPILLLEVEPLYRLIDIMYGAAKIFYEGLELLASYSFILTKPFTQSHLLFIAFFGASLLILPKGFLPRWPGIVLLVVSLSYRSSADMTSLIVRIVDVRQGLSVVFRSRSDSVI